MMNILFLTKEFPWPVNSGARMRTWHYIRGLVQAGEVSLVCGGNKIENGARHHFFTYFTGDDVDKKISAVARVKALFSPLPCAVSARVSARMKETARKAALESRCDVIICDGIHMALNVPMDVSCRKILDEHNVESTIIGRYFNVTRNPFVKAYVFLEWLKFRKFEERIWKQFDEIHVCSTADKIQVEKRSRHKNVHVVPNGVSVADAGSQSHNVTKSQEDFPVTCDMCHVTPNEKKSFRLVYSGLMGWQPNNDAALYFAKEIYPLVKDGLLARGQRLDARCNVEWFIVGKDPSLQVQALAQRDPSIIVTGFVEDVKPLIQSADVFVVPLRIGSGTRLKILEAMAMGCAVVSTSIGCEGLDVTHGENILIADAPQDFADSVIRLLNDAEWRGRIACAGRELVQKKYDWGKIESQLAGLINN